MTVISQTRRDSLEHLERHEPELTFVLVHGAFQTGAAWESVAAELRRRRHKVYMPTLARLGQDASENLAHTDVVALLVAYLREHELSDVVLVGHSLAGIFIAQVAQEVPELVKRLVFQNAYVVEDGNALVDEFPPEQAGFFRAGDPDERFILPFEVIRELACNDVDLATAKEIYAGLSPIPVSYLTDRLDLKVFYELVGAGKIRTSYVNARNDIALPPGEYAWLPRFAQRLGPLCRVLQFEGSHYAMTTRPVELATTLVQAGRD